METVLLVVQVLICVALIIVVLIQRSESDGFGLGSGSGAGVMSGRAAANLLTRTTAILAAMFMINSLLLSVVVTQRNESTLIDVIEAQEVTESGEIIPSVPVEKPLKAAVDAANKSTLSDKKPAVPAAK
jgi:preprotein translocase subunit SecG